MIIGVDAGMLGITDDRLKVGVWRVAVNLLTELGKLDQDNIYRLYSFAPIPQTLMKQFGSRMENRVLKPPVAWFSARLPIELALFPVGAFLGLAQSLPLAACPRIGFVYDLGFLRYPRVYPDSRERLTRQTRQLVSRADHIAAISQAVKDDLLNTYRLLPEQISVIHPGFDKRFTPRGKVFKGRVPYFLFVGALKRGKNVPLLLESFNQFSKASRKPYNLYLAGGDFWWDPEISKKVKEFNLEKHVRFLNFVADEELPVLYRGAVAFVSPSLTEGFCLPAVEAMACGTPVIVSDIAVMREIVGKAGLFVDPKDPVTLTKALQKISQDSSFCQQLRQAGLKQAGRYSWRATAKQVLALLQEFHTH